MKPRGFANNAAAMQDRNIRERIAVFEAYGGARCACCGETEESFLSLDHIDQNGAAERVAFFKNKYIAGHHMYRELRLRGYPPGYQVLCMNCQVGRRDNNGVCPHVTKPLSALERLAELQKLRTGSLRSLTKDKGEIEAALTRIRRKAQHSLRPVMNVDKELDTN